MQDSFILGFLSHVKLSYKAYLFIEFKHHICVDGSKTDSSPKSLP